MNQADKKLKKETVEWLVQHLPGGPEAHLDDLPRIILSLDAKPLSFLIDLKDARQKIEEKEKN